MRWAEGGWEGWAGTRSATGAGAHRQQPWAVYGSTTGRLCTRAVSGDLMWVAGGGNAGTQQPGGHASRRAATGEPHSRPKTPWLQDSRWLARQVQNEDW